MVGAMRAAALAGKTGLVTVPRVVADEPPETAAGLFSRAVEDLAGQGVCLAQALLRTDHGPDAGLLERGGFRHAWDLLYLVSLPAAFPDAPPAEKLDFVPYSRSTHRPFAELVERTYADSLDCPALDGVRQVDDVLDGYRAASNFDPALWLSVRHAGADVGCLLISAEAEHSQWELTYMGVVPEARRRGVGLTIARHAQWLARTSGCGRLVLGVDADNAPAQCVYAAAGFVTWDRRSVFLRVF
jgi:ribosomal protein S18 acetylase RimI-like enzyme